MKIRSTKSKPGVGVQRTLARRMQWGIVYGAVSLVDSLVALLSLGLLTSDLTMQVLLRMTRSEHRRIRAKEAKSWAG